MEVVVQVIFYDIEQPIPEKLMTVHEHPYLPHPQALGFLSSQKSLNCIFKFRYKKEIIHSQYQEILFPVISKYIWFCTYVECTFLKLWNILYLRGFGNKKFL